jgi:hypothetical protein
MEFIRFLSGIRQKRLAGTLLLVGLASLAVCLQRAIETSVGSRLLAGGVCVPGGLKVKEWYRGSKKD